MLLAIITGDVVAACEDESRDFGLDAPSGAEIVLVDDSVTISNIDVEIVEEDVVTGYELDEDDNVVETTATEISIVLPSNDVGKVDPRTNLDVAKVKSMKLADLARYTEHYIKRTYPTQKQIDIAAGRNGWQASDLTAMNTWIAARYTAAGTHRTAINALTTVPDLIAYDYHDLGT